MGWIKKPSEDLFKQTVYLKCASCVQTSVDIFNQVGCLLLTYLNIFGLGAFVKDWK